MNELKDWLRIELDWCDCWDPAAMQIFRAYLRYLRDLRDAPSPSSEYVVKVQNRDEWFGAPNEYHRGLAYLLAGMCGRMGLIEHGTSVRCSFLTEKGDQVLEMIDGVEDFEAWWEI